MGRGHPIFPGTGKTFRVADVNLLQAIAARDGDQIQVTGYLSQTDFTTPTNDPPPDPNSLPALVPISEFPVNATTAVPINTVANVVMLRSIDPTTITLGTSVTFSPPVGGLTAYVDPTNPTQIDFDPHGANLAFLTPYTITVTTGVKDVFGANVTPGFSWGFTTAAAPPPPDTDPPVVSSVSPTNGLTGVSVNTTVVIVINEAEGMDPTTVNGTNVVLKNNVNAVIPSTITLGPDNKTITITPSSPLAYSTVHNVFVSGCKDVNGNIMTAFTSTFTTAAAGFTLIYNVSGSTSFRYSLTQFTGFGEMADSLNGMIGKRITKVTMNRYQRFSGTGGNLVFKIIDAASVVRYTFGTVIAVGNAVGGYGPVTIQDVGNTYVMQQGDFAGWIWTGVTGGAGISDAGRNVFGGGKGIFFDNPGYSALQFDYAGAFYSS